MTKDLKPYSLQPEGFGSGAPFVPYRSPAQERSAEKVREKRAEEARAKLAEKDRADYEARKAAGEIKSSFERKKTGGSVKGWGKARGARKAKVY